MLHCLRNDSPETGRSSYHLKERILFGFCNPPDSFTAGLADFEDDPVALVLVLLFPFADLEAFLGRAILTIVIEIS